MIRTHTVADFKFAASAVWATGALGSQMGFEPMMIDLGNRIPSIGCDMESLVGIEPTMSGLEGRDRSSRQGCWSGVSELHRSRMHWQCLPALRCTPHCWLPHKESNLDRSVISRLHRTLCYRASIGRGGRTRTCMGMLPRHVVSL